MTGADANAPVDADVERTEIEHFTRVLADQPTVVLDTPTLKLWALPRVASRGSRPVLVSAPPARETTPMPASASIPLRLSPLGRARGEVTRAFALRPWPWLWVVLLLFACVCMLALLSRQIGG